jgi:hypothetical protein
MNNHINEYRSSNLAEADLAKRFLKVEQLIDMESKRTAKNAKGAKFKTFSPWHCP